MASFEEITEQTFGVEHIWRSIITSTITILLLLVAFIGIFLYHRKWKHVKGRIEKNVGNCEDSQCTVEVSYTSYDGQKRIFLLRYDSDKLKNNMRGSSIDLVYDPTHPSVAYQPGVNKVVIEVVLVILMFLIFIWLYVNIRLRNSRKFRMFSAGMQVVENAFASLGDMAKFFFDIFS